MKPAVALFKKKSMKLYLLLKFKIQANGYQHSCMLFAQEEKRKENCSEQVRVF